MSDRFDPGRLDPGGLAGELVRAAGIADREGRPTLGRWPLHVLALGWATVDLDRATTELAERFGRKVQPGSDGADDLLGARVRRLIGAADTAGAGDTGDTADTADTAVAAAADIDSAATEPAVLLLEPATEGRLAAALARRGEGPAVLYLGSGAAGGPHASADDRRSDLGDRDFLTELAAAGIRFRAGHSALGVAGLVLGGPPGGPQLVLVAVPSGS